MVVFILGIIVKEEVLWGYFSQKIIVPDPDRGSQEPGCYSRTRCFSCCVEIPTLGSGLWLIEMILFKIYTVITPRLLALQRHLILLLNCFSAQQEAEIRLVTENQGPECRISCNYGNLVRCFLIIIPTSRLNI